MLTRDIGLLGKKHQNQQHQNIGLHRERVVLRRHIPLQGRQNAVLHLPFRRQFELPLAHLLRP